MADKIHDVLFLRTGNSARSVLAESILRKDGHIRKEAALVAAFRYMKARISLLTALPLASIDKMALGTKLGAIVSWTARPPFMTGPVDAGI